MLQVSTLSNVGVWLRGRGLHGAGFYSVDAKTNMAAKSVWERVPTDGTNNRARSSVVT